MQLSSERFGLQAQLSVKDNDLTSASFSIKNCTLRNCQMEHFFQGHRLRTELHLVTVVRLGPTPLLLDRVRDNFRAGTMKLNHIGDTGQTQKQRTKPYSVLDPNGPPLLTAFPVDAIVHHTAFRGLPVFVPELLDMYQRTLPRTKGQVLKSGQRKQIVFLIHFLLKCRYSISSISIPSGTEPVVTL